MTPHPLPCCPECNGRLKFGTCWGYVHAMWRCDAIDGMPCKNEQEDGRDPIHGWDSCRWRCVNGCNFDLCEECLSPPDERLTPYASLSELSVGEKVYYCPTPPWGCDWTVQRVWEVKNVGDNNVALHLGNDISCPSFASERDLPYASGEDFDALLGDCYELTMEHTAEGEIIL